MYNVCETNRRKFQSGTDKRNLYSPNLSVFRNSRPQTFTILLVSTMPAVVKNKKIISCERRQEFAVLVAALTPIFTH